jgi:hypothetical protein
MMNVDTSKWSGEGEFTQLLLDYLRKVPEVAAVRVEDAPATRSEADYNFISNELYVDFASETRQEVTRKWGVVPVRHLVETKTMTIPQLEVVLASDTAIGPPDYADAGMLQYLRAERIIPPYQTRGYKLVELVRVYEAGKATR